jgi:hypothetical protein
MPLCAVQLKVKLMEPTKLFAALCVGIVLSATVPARGADEPPLLGVWAGQLGKNDIVACFNSDEHGSRSASYYYARYLKPIHLEVNEDNVLLEDGAAGRWHLAAPKDGRLSGTWQDEKTGKVLNIALVLRSDGANHGACGSDAYNSAIEFMPPLQTGKIQEFNHRKFRTLRIGSATTVELLGSGPTFKPINAQLRTRLPNSLTDYFAERRDSLARDGDAKEGATEVQLTFWSASYISIDFTYSPPHAANRFSDEIQHQSWNLQTGQELDLWSWFEPASKHDPNGFRPLPAKLARLADKRGRDGPCADENYMGKGLYRPMLVEDGIAFWENETEAAGCQDILSLKYTDLPHVMTPAGKAALPALMHGH